MKNVRIVPPYNPDNVKGDSTASNHVRKIVSLFFLKILVFLYLWHPPYSGRKTRERSGVQAGRRFQLDFQFSITLGHISFYFLPAAPQAARILLKRKPQRRKFDILQVAASPAPCLFCSEILWNTKLANRNKIKLNLHKFLSTCLPTNKGTFDLGLKR